ncbi:site-specific integrase [Rummeliibacillus pycnus]|uniref:site-specific integrase n=1 Tax=Rummeliibacillus pycnus TaxID=101070 RepID=UPI0037CBBE55
MNLDVQQSFFQDHQARFSSETIRGYKIALNQFFSFCGKDYDSVKSTDIRSWLASMEEKGLKPRSINIKFISMRVLMLHLRVVKNSFSFLEPNEFLFSWVIIYIEFHYNH